MINGLVLYSISSNGEKPLISYHPFKNTLLQNDNLSLGNKSSDKFNLKTRFSLAATLNSKLNVK